MKVILVAGARPNFMKIAPIAEALRASRDAVVRLVHTGQHYDAVMSGDIFRDLRLPEPDYFLRAGAGSHAVQTAKVMTAFEPVCIEEKPDWVVVVGDVNSTIACALTAKKLNIRVAHVEAGLRSRDRSMPEEINRLCTDAISDVLFTTDAASDANLLAEGVPPERIHMVGNTMIDTLLAHLDRAVACPLPEGAVSGTYGVVTLHRPANVDSREPLSRFAAVMAEVARRLPLIFPVHPRTHARLEEFGLIDGLRKAGVRMLGPLSYLPFIGLVARSRLVLTDSGGIQDETTVLGIPCVTARENTERPITCSMGTNVLAGREPDGILAAVGKVLQTFGRPKVVPAMWDGRAGTRIASLLLAE